MRTKRLKNRKSSSALFSTSELLLPALLLIFCPTAPHPIYCSFPVLLLLFCSTAPLATYFSSSLQYSPCYYLFLSFYASSTLYFCHSALLLFFCPNCSSSAPILFYSSPFYLPFLLYRPYSTAPYQTNDPLLPNRCTTSTKKEHRHINSSSNLIFFTGICFHNSRASGPLKLSHPCSVIMLLLLRVYVPAQPLNTFLQK
jgi:hypothetical protein